MTMHNGEPGSGTTYCTDTAGTSRPSTDTDATRRLLILTASPICGSSTTSTSGTESPYVGPGSARIAAASAATSVVGPAAGSVAAMGRTSTSTLALTAASPSMPTIDAQKTPPASAASAAVR